MNTNLKTLTRQQKPQQTRYLNPLYEVNPHLELSKFTTTKLSLFSFLLEKSRKWRKVEPSQDYLAQELGVTRPYINRLIGQLEEDGLITYEYRHRHTSVYRVSEFFSQPHIRKKLANLLPAILTLVVFPLHLLGTTIQSSSLHHYKKRSIRRENNNVSYYYSLSTKISNLSSYRAHIRDARVAVPPETDMFDLKAFRFYIQRLTKINVSDWGAIKLSAFPDYVLTYCSKVIEREKPSLSKYNHYFYLCFNFCKKRNIELDITLIAKRAQRENVSVSDNVLQEIPQQEPSSQQFSFKDFLYPVGEKTIPRKTIKKMFDPVRAAQWNRMFPPPSWTK